MITQEFNIDIVPGGIPPRVSVNQYDTGLRTLIAHIYQGDDELVMTNSYTYTVVGTKPSGTGFSYAATVQNGAIAIDVTGQMTVVSGYVVCNILVTDSNDNQVGSHIFILDVQKAALTVDTIIDSDDFDSIVEAAVGAWMRENYPAESTGNLVELAGKTINGVTLTVAEDGTLDFDGTASASCNFVLTNSPLAAGTYSAKMYPGLGGTISDATKITLRTRTSVIGDSTAVSSTTRWLNSANQELSGASATTFADPVYVAVNIASGTVLSHYKIRFQIEAGTTIGEYAPAKTAVDYVARDAVSKVKTALIVKYVSASGSDNNDGNSESKPYATIARALADGASVINLAAGAYSEIVYNSTARNVTINGYGAVWTVDASAMSDKDAVIDLRLGSYVIKGITINVTGAIDDHNFAGMLIRNANATLIDCTIAGTYDSQSNTGAPQNCFRLDGSKVTLIRCKATGATVDGFNSHDTTGHVSEGTFIDCIATGNGDDGLSYHDNGTIHVHGGQFFANGSTGIAPHNGCNCEIYGAYIHDNASGIEAFNTNPTVGAGTDASPYPLMVCVGCIITGNTSSTSGRGYGVSVKYYRAILKDCTLSGNSAGTYTADTYSTVTVLSSGGGSSISPYASNPAALGTASPGASDDYARGDHVHDYPTDLKNALLQLASKVAYIDNGGTSYYNDLYAALNHAVALSVTNTLTNCTSSNGSATVPSGAAYTATITASAGYTLTGATVSITMGGVDVTSTAYNNGVISIASVTGALVITISAASSAATLVSISAVYTQSGTVYDTDSLDSLKADLVVTATYSDTSTATVAASDYTLSGTLEVGTSTITVTYEGETDTFTVTVTEGVTFLYNWDLKQSLVDSVGGVEIELGAATGVNNATRSSSGLTFNAATQTAYLGNILLAGKTIEIDVSSFVFAGNTSRHIRLLVNTNYKANSSSQYGLGSLIWRSSYGWSSYGWTNSNATTKGWSGACWSSDLTGTSDSVINAFSGKTIKIIFDSDGHTKKLYIDGILEGTMTDIYFNSSSNHIFIGGMSSWSASDGDQCYNMTITGIRIYENE